MCDKLVFDLSQEVEGSPNVFIRKDWINILDNMNQNYQNNQCIIDTSQLANSNKYMAYREAYLAMPMLGTAVFVPDAGVNIAAALAGGDLYPGDFTLGLKNWFGSMIHSFTLDYNGTTIIQQTPFINMWNIFKLLTSLSYQDVITMGATIGFYPDSFGSQVNNGAAAGVQGVGICNTDMATYCSLTSSTNGDTQYLKLNNYDIYSPIGGSGGNRGATYRTKWIAYNVGTGAVPGAGITYPGAGVYRLAAGGANIGTLFSAGYMDNQACTNMWKSYISRKQPFVAGAVTPATIQYSITAIIYLRHVHSFFNMCPLLKGVFMKLTMNLNNCSHTTVINLNAANPAVGRATYTSYTTSNPVGGVSPILVPSLCTGNNWITQTPTAGATNMTAYYNISVGSVCLNQTMLGLAGANITTGGVSKSVYLYVPAYTFNPPFEQAYLSNSVKQIKYTDVYQYQYTTSINGNSPFNFLVTNGIANIKSVLIIPFFKQGVVTAGQGAVDYAEYQSPFDTAGCGTTAPMISLGNFNVQISGQNAIYNTQRYTYEEFVNQLYGQNSVNGGMTDGLTSSLIDFSDFQNSASYYYVNVERMLPVEQSVPKSVQIIGTNFSAQAIQFWVFIEYGVEVKIDVLTGARV